jgi:iron complex outermembrane receptor protein
MKFSRPCIFAAIAVAPATAGAQVATPATPSTAQTDDSAGLGDIIVTAQKRAENVQNVPIAVTAVTEEDVTLLGVTDPQNLTQLVPGFTFQRNSSSALPFLRGIGSTGSIIGSEPSVAIFLDDVYIPTGKAAIFEFNNISSIEALKGPQGTLFGRNATGGVVHVHTKRPSLNDVVVDASVGYGNYDTWTGQLYVSVPLSDKVAVNLAAFGTKQNDGWGRNFVSQNGGFVPDDDRFTNESWGVNGKLLFEPSDDFNVLLGGIHAERKSDQGMALRVVPGTFGFANYSPEAIGLGFYDTAENFHSIGDSVYDQVSLKLERNFTGATFRSISAYSKIDTKLLLDTDASPTNAQFADTPNWGKTFTQEVQLLSPEGSSLNWIIGAFYMHDTSFYSFNIIGTSPTGSAAFIGGPGNYLRERSKQITNSISAFAQMTNEILPDTNLTIGARYTLDSRKEVGAGSEISNHDRVVLVVNGVPQASGPFSSKTDFKDVTGRISLDHHFTPDLMGYVAYNRGFKSGVYNLPGYSPASTGPLPAVAPEKLYAFTIGFKSEWFDSRLRINAEAFYYDYRDIQVQNAAPPPLVGTILINGGKATIKGFDVDLAFAPTSNLKISGSISVLDGKYDEFDNAPVYFPLPPDAPKPIPAGCPAGTTYPPDSNNAGGTRNCSLAGNKTVMTPPFTSTLSVIYTIPTSFGDFDVSANWQHGGNFFSEPDNNATAKQPTFDLVNSSIRWTAPNGRYDVRLWANNILEEKYYSYVSSQTRSGVKYAPAAPRTYGVTFGFHY